MVSAVCTVMTAVPSKTSGMQLMIPGPVECHPDVLAPAGAASVPAAGPQLVQMFAETMTLLRQVLSCRSGQVFVIPASGTFGWDLVCANLIEAGDAVLVITTGYFGDKFGEALETYGARVTYLRASRPGDAHSLEDIERAVQCAPEGGYKAVTITHVDTSTDVLMDVQSIASVVQRVSPSSMVVVDGVCSVGGEDLKMDEWGIDVVLTAPQKALSAPPGLSILAASDKALRVLEQRTTPIPTYYASLRKHLPVMRGYEEGVRRYFGTPAVQLVAALLVSLKQILAQTPDLEDRFSKHRSVSDRVKRTLTSWGLTLVPTHMEHAAHTLTAAYLPEGLDMNQLIASMMAKGVIITSGIYADIPPHIRLGHMGYSAMEEDKHNHVDKMLAALKTSLTELGYTGTATATKSPTTGP